MKHDIDEATIDEMLRNVGQPLNARHHGAVDLEARKTSPRGRFLKDEVTISE
jgi:hypothetical protein